MASNVKIFSNNALGGGGLTGRTSTVGEPSLANNGKHVFFTGNWYTARSADSGASWDFIKPDDFPPPVDNGFCCDQTVHYDQSRDLTIWILQYVKTDKTNTLRIAVKKGSLDTPNGWVWWDLKPGNVNSEWKGEWFDYNHAALSNNFLYVGTNSFHIKKVPRKRNWARSIIFRLPLDDLAAAGNPSLDYFDSTDDFSLRCAQGATDTMFFVSHGSNTRQLRLYNWPESSTTVSVRNITIKTWSRGRMSAPGPGGNDNWLKRCDSRITGVWHGSGILGVMWIANRQGTARPFPFVRVARIDTALGRVVSEPDIWSKKTAYAYPAASANIQGTPGVSLFAGGGDRHPSHVVGFFDGVENVWRLTTAATSTHSPEDEKWGDYLACRRHSPDGLSWIASGFTLNGGGTMGDIVPRYVHFGVDAHQAATERWAGV